MNDAYLLFYLHNGKEDPIWILYSFRVIVVRIIESFAY